MKAAILILAAALAASAAQITAAGARVVPNVAGTPAGGVRPMRIALGTFAELEKRFDGKLGSLGGVNNPTDLLGTTRGIYLDGYGAVFTSEMSLIVTPGINPFRPTITDALKAQVHQEKIARVPKLKEALREMAKTAALTLIQVPDNQQIVIAVRLDYLQWEDTMGLPGLIIVKADRRSALAGNFQVEEQ